MSAINFHTKEISVKIVYYGPGLCGKTTTLQSIYGTLPEERRPQLVSLATDVDRTIFFDFLPLTAYRIRDFKVRLQLYTVPGQVFYNATRKLVLNGVDGVVFVADSQRAMRDSNVESLQNLEENLADLGLDINKIPLVMQFNKRDLPDVFPVEEMDKLYNTRQVPVFATTATTGEGLFEALKAISQKVVNDLIRKGLGQQLQQQRPTQTPQVEPPEPSEGLAASFLPMEEALAKADGSNNSDSGTDSQVTSGKAVLWPPGEVAQLGEVVTTAMESENWRDAVLAVEKLLDNEVHRWAAHEGRKPADALATFLFLRGVPASRYRVYVKSLVVARAGKEVDQATAMNALTLALEAIW